MCFDFLYSFCPKHFSFYGELSEILSHMFTGLRVKYSLLLSILMKLEFSQQIFGKYANVNFITIRPVDAYLFLADRRPGGQTDGRTGIQDEANSRFSRFCEHASYITFLKQWCHETLAI